MRGFSLEHFEDSLTMNRLSQSERIRWSQTPDSSHAFSGRKELQETTSVACTRWPGPLKTEVFALQTAVWVGDNKIVFRGLNSLTWDSSARFDLMQISIMASSGA